MAAFDCVEKDNPTHQQRRASLYLNFDGNENGYISLSETGGGIMQVLSNIYGQYGQYIYKRFYRSYIRAFTDAKDASPARDQRDDDYVTRSEFRLLWTLAKHPGRVYTRDELVKKLTDGEVVILDRNIDVHVSSIRKKLGGEHSIVTTVRGVGYKCVEPSS